MADSKPNASRPKSTKVNFVLLKQILENESSENTEVEDPGTISEGNESNQDDGSVEKPRKEKDNFGPTGRYPVLFSKRCRSKSCQTRLSAFPLFSVPEDAEWISDEEENHKTNKNAKSDEKKRRRRRDSSDSKTSKNVKNQEKMKENNKEVKIEEKTKNPDGTRKEFHSEHQLKDTKNPILQAWLHQKNKLARKMRKEDRKIKRAQRAALEEEIRLKNERFEQSEKKVSEWFKSKRKEARRSWRQNHPKVSPLEMAEDEPNTNSPPPPEYRVVRSFKSQQASSTVRQRSGSASSASAGMNKNTVTGNGNKSRVKGDLSAGKNKEIYSDISSPTSTSTSTKMKESHNVINVKPERILTKEQSTELPHKSPERPKTAHSRTASTRKNVTRPKTASSSTKTTQIEKQKATKSTTKMHSLNYDQWLKLKREQDKKSVIEKRRELIDVHLDAVIAKLGKQRVEKIMSPRKRVDTGLKSYDHSDAKTLPVVKKSSYQWVSEHDAPRPEPQGCDCPEFEHIDGKASLVPDKGLTFCNSNLEQCQLSPTSQKKQAVNFCKEVTDKCENLKPAMDKVLAVLDAEIQKCAKDKKTNKKSPSYKAPSGISSTNAVIRATDSEISSDMNTLNIPESIESSSTVSEEKDIVLSARPKSPRPKSARPRLNLVDNTSLTAEEAKKKILHDMDVLGLCEDADEAVKDDINNNENPALENKDNMSTVRSNYFDYGTDVDTPTMEKLEL